MEFDSQALLASFVAEAGELLQEMERALMQLEQRGEEDELQQLLLRHAHTLKGNASTVGLEHLTSYIHRFEDLLETSLERRALSASPVVSAVLAVVDILRDAVLAADHELPAVAGEVLAAAEQIARGAFALAGPSAGGRHLHVVEKAAVDRSIRVPIEKLDRVLDLTGELVIARGRVMQSVSGDHGCDRVLEALSDLERLDDQLRELVMRLRMVPIGPELQRFARMVRDVAMANGKVVRLVVEGGDVEIDSAVMATLRDSLSHMLRNAIDHGIELPDDRERRGKPRVGTITLRGRHSGATVIVEMEDDGAGLDRERIALQARRAGLISETAAPSDYDLCNLIFEPGFSTTDEANEVSGRGIGMDVVRCAVESLRGTIEISSSAGAGTTFRIRLPLTLAIIDGFAVSVGLDNFIVPLDLVVECIDLPPGADTLRHEGLVTVRGEVLPFIRLRHHLQVEAEPPDRETVVVVEYSGRRFGLASDRIVGKTQTVIKPLGTLLKRARGVSAAAILGSGDVAFILDIPQLLQSAAEPGAVHAISA